MGRLIVLRRSLFGIDDRRAIDQRFHASNGLRISALRGVFKRRSAMAAFEIEG